MKNLLIIILIFFSCISNGQEIKTSSFKKNTSLFNKEINTNLSGENLPFQFGIEFGVPVKVFGKNFFTSGLFGYLNINLSKKNVFLKFEYGNMWLNNELKVNTVLYAAISVTGQIVKISEISKVYFDFGYGLYSNKNNYLGGGVKFAITYFQSLNKLTSIFASVKVPLFSEAREGEYHYNPFLTLGIQLF